MEPPKNELSAIQTAFKDSTIFLTGGTGFVGKLLLEKLLRSLDVKHIYMVIRPKKNLSIEARLAKLFESPMFERIVRSKIDYKSKITLISGDLLRPNLGLSSTDTSTIINEVTYVFHCAATVKFDEPLDVATKINVRATRDLLEIGKQIRNLKGFIHVSTAYSNSNRLDIDEKFYEPPINGHNLINTIESLDVKYLDGLTKDLLGDKFKNTYIFTKNVAESLVQSEGGNLPIVIARPSIITSTSEEPIEAFIDNYYGFSGILMGVGLGILRTLYLADVNIDIIPGDFVVNNIIACGWYLGAKKNLEKKASNIKYENNVPIFNLVSTVDNPINAYTVVEYFRSDCFTVKALWYPCTIFTDSRIKFQILEFFGHTSVAYLADFALWVTGKKTWVVKTFHKFRNLFILTEFFYTTPFEFTNSNNRELLGIMSDVDKTIFYSDLKNLDWMVYANKYYKGVRVYLLKDPMETLPEGVRLMKKYKFIENCGLVFLVLLFLFTFYVILF